MVQRLHLQRPLLSAVKESYNCGRLLVIYSFLSCCTGVRESTYVQFHTFEIDLEHIPPAVVPQTNQRIRALPLGFLPAPTLCGPNPRFFPRGLPNMR